MISGGYQCQIFCLQQEFQVFQQFKNIYQCILFKLLFQKKCVQDIQYQLNKESNMKGEEQNWLPLQSNPKVMNDFLKDLGFNTKQYAVHQVLSIEDWAQEMLPRPIFGVVFLFEVTKAQRQFAKMQSETLDIKKVPESIYFMKQHAKNACGTIALLHVLLNQIQRYPDLFEQECFLSNFLLETLDKNPEERGTFFQQNKGLKEKHKTSVKKGQTKVEERVETHFIAFIEKEGCLFEMDGTKKMPVNHGECTPEGLVMMACLVIQQFMSRNPESIKFTILALGSKD